MQLLWPGFLLLLLVVPLLIAVYVWMQRRRRVALRYSSLLLIRAALPRQSRWRRHVPFALLLLALTSLIVAVGRPVTVVSMPSDQTTIMLAIDVSRSMSFTDIQPSRIEAAQNAALSFIRQQKAKTQIGIVAFSGYADLIQPPTTDQEALQSAIESLTMGRATAIGSGILKSVDAIAGVDKNVAPSVNGTGDGVAPAPVPKGMYAPDIIVLLTDGVSNAGPEPIDAAQQAVDRGIRVYTIGFGTEAGPTGLQFGGGGQGRRGGQGFGGGGQGFGGGGFGGGGQGFGGFRRGIDDQALKQIAEMTGGTYYPAASAGELQNVFQKLPTYLITKHALQEISVAFAAAGALLAALAMALSLRWQPLPGA